MRSWRTILTGLSSALKHVLVLSSISIAVSAQSAEETSATIELATRPDLPPYIYNGATYGIEVDIVKAIFQEMGYKTNFVQMDRVEMVNRFNRGEIMGSLTQNVANNTHGCATRWYLVHQNVGFSLASKDIQAETLSDLKGLRVLSFHNATTFLGEKFAQAVAENPNYEEVAPQSKHIDLIYQNKYDIVVGDEWILRLVQRRHYESTGEYHPLKLHQIMTPTFYSARFQTQELCDSFNTALRTLRRRGVYDQVVDGYHQRILVASNSE